MQESPEGTSVPENSTVAPSAGCLLFFIDETGHEEYADPTYPLFGMGGCAHLAGYCWRDLDGPWQNLRRIHFPGLGNSPMHASKQRCSPDQAAALGDFFRNGFFSRFAVMTRASTTRPENVTVLRLVASCLVQQVLAISRYYSLDSLGFVIEDSDRTNAAVAQAFAGVQFKNNQGSIVPTSWNFLPKASREPGLEVADFVLHAAGGQVRHRLQGKQEFRKDYDAVFRTKFPTQFIDVEASAFDRPPGKNVEESNPAASPSSPEAASSL